MERFTYQANIEEIHDIPEDGLATHRLDPYCECRPEPVIVERDPDGTLVSIQLVHRAEAPIAEPMAVR